MRLIRRVLVVVAALLALVLAAAAGTREAAAADDALDLGLRSGAAFKGRIGARDDAEFVLRSEGGGNCGSRGGTSTSGRGSWRSGWSSIRRTQGRSSISARKRSNNGRWPMPFLDDFKIHCDGAPHAEAFERAWGRTDRKAFQGGFEARCRWLVDRARAQAAGDGGK